MRYKSILVYLLLWFIVNLLFLTNYPFVHTDEPWLSGLSRSMIESENPGSTEDFFDLYERNPHGIKIIFHLFQIVFIKTLGYSILSVRLISLITASLSLLLFYNLILTFFDSKKQVIALITTIWISIDIQFIYLSHFARQEILLILTLLIMLNLIVTNKIPSLQRGLITGIAAGLSAGIHPNSFIIAWPIGLILLIDIMRKKRKWSEGLFFIVSAGITSLIFIGFSFYLNPDFLVDYRAYGEPLGVLDSPDRKLLKLPPFYNKLFKGISGTYHTPEIKLQMLLYPLFLLFSFMTGERKLSYYSLTAFIGFNAGLVIIGKYSQPSIGFLLPFYYLTASGLVSRIITFKNRTFLKTILIGFMISLIFLTLLFSLKEIGKEKERFPDYINEINTVIPQDSIILGDLYMDFVIPQGQLYDWRNLSFLRANGMTLQQYIDERDIQYIVLPGELSFIYKNRPYWNVLYGNIAHWYPQILTYTDSEYMLIKEIKTVYGNRIASHRYERQGFVKIYKINH